MYAVGHWSELIPIKEGTTGVTEYLQSNIYNLVIIAILMCLIVYPILRVRRYIENTLSSNKSPEDVRVESKEDLTGEYMLYVITYIFPFMTAAAFTVLGIIALVGALTIIGLLYIRANLFHVNPALLLIYNYRLYKIVDDKRNVRHLLSKNESLLNGARVYLLSLNDVLYVEKSYQPKDSTHLLER